MKVEEREVSVETKTEKVLEVSRTEFEKILKDCVHEAIAEDKRLSKNDPMVTLMNTVLYTLFIHRIIEKFFGK